MPLSSDLISQFVKITKDDNRKANKEETVYGTIVEYEGSKYVKFDGSDLLTPATSTATTDPGDRVTVQIKNHMATVTGNLSSPSAKNTEVEKIGAKISEFEVIIADKVSTEDLEAETARIDELVSENVTIKGVLNANSADIDELQADNVTIKGELSAQQGYIKDLEAEDVEINRKLTARDAEIDSLQADNVVIKGELTAHKASIDDLETKKASIDDLNAEKARIDDLEVNKLDAESADIRYANIDFTNIGKAAMEYFYATSGLIKNVVVGDQTITGNLVGVTISGDLIEGNTVKADKLVVKGSDGLYYKLNIDGGVTTSEEVTDQDLQNGLHGSVIIAKTITAEQISVKDLVAFDATIGGFVIDEDSIHSFAKTTVDNTTRGIYMDNDGQFAVGDTTNFIKYYKDTDGTYKLAISASQMVFGGTQKSVEEVIDEVKTDVDALRNEITTLLRIESSRGTVFKNNTISTVLSAVIYHGTQRITDSATMKSVFGSGAYLQWKWQRLDEDTYGIISASDSRFGDNGFTFTISPEDVDTKVTFMCELIV